MKDRARWLRLALISMVEANQKLMTVDGLLGNEKFEYGDDAEIQEIIYCVLNLKAEAEELENKLRNVWAKKEN